jgi:hypothetical protein
VTTRLLPLGLCLPACNAILAFAVVVDFLVASTILGPACANDLRLAIDLFLGHCVDAGWKNNLHSKFHWLIHLPDELIRFKRLLTCWVHERKHKMVKRYAQNIYNTRVYERSILSEVTSHHLANLRSDTAFDLRIGLLTQRVAPKHLHAKLADILQMPINDLQVNTCIDSRYSRYGTCRRGDVVLVASHGGLPACAGRVHAHVEVEGIPISLVALWEQRTDNIATGFVDWSERHALTCIGIEMILTPITHTRIAADVVRTILPLHVRHLFG